jgi:hypothetical protein
MIQKGVPECNSQKNRKATLKGIAFVGTLEGQG